MYLVKGSCMCNCGEMASKTFGALPHAGVGLKATSESRQILRASLSAAGPPPRTAGWELQDVLIDACDNYSP